MTMQDSNFWRQAGEQTPGMLNLGVGLWGTNAARKEGQAALNAAQGPEYQAAMGASRAALGQAGSMDPKAMAQERYNAAQGLLQGQDAKSEADMMRMLHAKGMLGAANYNPGVEGITPNGTAMNPQMAAFYAARGARDGRMAFDSLREGEQQVNSLVDRSGKLQSQANAGRASNMAAGKAVPSKAAGTAKLLQSGLGLAKDTGLLGALPGMMKGSFDWLGGQTGLWGGFDAANMNLSDMRFGFDDMDGIA
jgi:hypothetical protein